MTIPNHVPARAFALSRAAALGLALAVAASPASADDWSKWLESDVRSLRAAVEAGDVGAKVALGIRHSEGDGVEPSFDEAWRLWHEAANDGHAFGQYLFALLHNHESYVWFALAAAGGVDAARRARDAAASVMRTEDLRSAKDDARQRLREIQQR